MGPRHPGDVSATRGARGAPISVVDRNRRRSMPAPQGGRRRRSTMSPQTAGPAGLGRPTPAVRAPTLGLAGTFLVSAGQHRQILRHLPRCDPAVERNAARAGDRQPVAVRRQISRVTFEAAMRAVRPQEVFEVGRDSHATQTATVASGAAGPVHRQDCRTRPAHPSRKIESRLSASRRVGAVPVQGQALPSASASPSLSSSPALSGRPSWPPATIRSVCRPSSPPSSRR